MPGSGYPILQVWIDFEHGPFETTTETWTEVTDYVRGNPVQISYGRDSQIDDFQPGQCRFTLANDDGIFDPQNGTGPYYGKLKPHRRVKVTSAYGLFYGYITGWPQRRESRNVGWVDITAVDELAMFAQIPMPESVWSWRVNEYIKAGKVTAWWRMGYETEVATDSSGNGNHGTWRVWENSNDPVGGLPAPKAVMAAGKVGPVIPSTEQPGTSFGMLQAEVGQPVGGTGSNSPRTVSLVGPQATADLVYGSWSVEVWGVFRQAFPVDVTNAYSSTTPIYQPILGWGQSGGVRWDLTLHSTGGYPIWYVYNETGTGIGWGGASTNLYDGAVHQIVVTYNVATFDLVMYVDGLAQWTINNSFVAAKPVTKPLVVNLPYFNTGLLESTLGDVVVYDTPLTATDVGNNWYCGRYGRYQPLGKTLQTNQAILQIFAMLNLPGAKWAVHYGEGLYVDPGISEDDTLLDYLRKINASEQGLMYVDAGGTLRCWGRSWMTSKPNGITPRGTFIDGVPLLGTEWGYASLSFGDAGDRLQNDVTVTFSGGQQRAQNTASQTDYGPMRGQVETLLSNPEAALQVANWRVWRDGQPPAKYSYPDKLVLEPNDNDFLPFEQLDIGHAVTVNYTSLGGSTAGDTYWIQSISHEIDPGRGLWRITLGLAPALEPAAPFRMDQSLLGGSDALWI